MWNKSVIYFASPEDDKQPLDLTHRPVLAYRLHFLSKQNPKEMFRIAIPMSINAIVRRHVFLLLIFKKYFVVALFFVVENVTFRIWTRCLNIANENENRNRMMKVCEFLFFHRSGIFLLSLRNAQKVHEVYIFYLKSILSKNRNEKKVKKNGKKRLHHTV